MCGKAFPQVLLLPDRIQEIGCACDEKRTSGANLAVDRMKRAEMRCTKRFFVVDLKAQ